MFVLPAPCSVFQKISAETEIFDAFSKKESECPHERRTDHTNFGRPE